MKKSKKELKEIKNRVLKKLLADPKKVDDWENLWTTTLSGLDLSVTTHTTSSSGEALTIEKLEQLIKRMEGSDEED